MEQFDKKKIDLVFESGLSDRIMHLLVHPEFTTTPISEKPLKYSNCHGTTAYISELTDKIREFSNQGRDNHGIQDYGIFEGIEERPGFIEGFVMEPFVKQNLTEVSTPKAGDLVYIQTVYMGGETLQHTGIFLGLLDDKPAFFHQINTQEPFDISTVDAYVISQGTFFQQHSVVQFYR